MKQFKKLLGKTALLLSASSLLLPSLAFADNPPDDGSIVQAIQQLGVQINALATAGANAVSDAVYQFDQNLPGIVQANSANSTLPSQISANTTTQTLANIKTSLQAFPQQVIPPNPAPANSVMAMTYGIPSSDTLYSPKDPQLSVFNANPQSIPNNDDYFDADSLLGPEAYTSDQQTAAQYYVNFVTQSYIPLGSTINFAPLAGLSYASFVNFQRNTQVYQNYQAGVRSYMALTSIPLSNFNQLMAERTVQQGLGTAAGLTVPTANGPQAVADASPLQIQEFIANRRVNSVQWYKDMAAASPATVQRESLFVLAEIESQLQQLHGDNERLLATLSAINLGTAITLKNQLATQESNVNSAIQAATSSDTAANNANFNPPPKQ